VKTGINMIVDVMSEERGGRSHPASHTARSSINARHNGIARAYARAHSIALRRQITRSIATRG